ncbi:MAG TPA: ubiquinol-cytochrome c reductase iron-sulfur subunit [Bdellovibrionota bacterium]|nr:ubiquinol-cytochrome c reductase iron-sulfur subunit [Bdellovibrionota bacterium]
MKPIRSSTETSRRGFLNTLLGASGFAWVGSVFYPIVRYLTPVAETEAKVSSAKVAAVSEIPPNSGKICKFGNKPALLVRKKDGSFAAFTGKCTHLDCIVQYRPDMERIWCACHNGQYDLNGNNVAGPPPHPLDTYEVHVQGEDVYISLKA